MRSFSCDSKAVELSHIGVIPAPPIYCGVTTTVARLLLLMPLLLYLSSLLFDIIVSLSLAFCSFSVCFHLTFSWTFRSISPSCSAFVPVCIRIYSITFSSFPLCVCLHLITISFILVDRYQRYYSLHNNRFFFFFFFVLYFARYVLPSIHTPSEHIRLYFSCIYQNQTHTRAHITIT